MADARSIGGLQTIFSFFLGLMVTAFVGVGVYTFHPPPHEVVLEEIQELNREEERVRGVRPVENLTEADRDRIQALNEERNRLNDRVEVLRRAWGRSTSIALIAFATLVMAVSLVRSDQLPVISNGLLLGGVFTMVYGVGWIVATDASTARFAVISAALVITLGLGYVRFVRTGKRTAVSGKAAAGGDSLADLEHRVQELEDRIGDAARVLTRND